MQRENGVNPGVYNGGATVFNNRPFVNYYLQQQAKKQAQDQALDTYYRDQAKSLTPTGMRAKDIEGGFSQKFNDWQQLGMEKKKFLLNPAADNYKTLNEFNRAKNDLHSDIEKSKQAAKDEDVIRTAKMSGKWNPTQDDYSIAEDNSKSIYDKTRQGLSLDQMSVNRAPLDLEKFITNSQQGMKRGTVDGTPVIDKVNGFQVTPSTDRYRPEEVKSMVDKVPFMVQNDPSAKDHFDRLLHSPQLPALQESYSKVYPDGGNVDTPEKAAQALVAMQASQPTNYSEKKTAWKDPKEEENRQMKMENIRFGHEKSLIGLRKNLAGKSSEEQSAGVDSYLTGIEDRAKKGKPMYLNLHPGSPDTKVFLMDASPNLLKSFERTDIDGKKILPNALGVADDGRHYPIFFKKESVKDANDEYFSDQYMKYRGGHYVDPLLTQPVSRDVTKAELSSNILTPKLTEANLGAEDQGNSVVAPSPKSRPNKPVKLTKGAFD